MLILYRCTKFELFAITSRKHADFFYNLLILILNVLTKFIVADLNCPEQVSSDYCDLIIKLEINSR